MKIIVLAATADRLGALKVGTNRKHRRKDDKPERIKIGNFII